MSWHKLDTSQLYPTSLSQIGNTIQAVNDGITGLMEVVGAAAELVNSVHASLTDPRVEAVRSTLNVARAALDSAALKQAGLHYLSVPMLAGYEDSWKGTIPVYADLDREKLSQLDNFLGPGGNLGFFNTVMQSLSDSKDLNRPGYGKEDHVAGLVLMAGSTNPIKAIELLLALQRLIGNISVGLDNNILPYPKNVRYDVCPLAATLPESVVSTKATPEAIAGVRLSWDPVFPVSAIPFGLTLIRVHEVVIYRSTEHFSSKLSRASLQKYEYKRFPYVPILNTFTDQNTPPSPTETKTTYYYAVGFTYDILDRDGVQTRVEDGRVSSVLTVPLSIPGIANTNLMAGGTPPNWRGLASGIDLMPSVREVLDTILAYVDTIDANYASTVTGTERMIIQLLEIMRKRKALIASTLDVLQEIQNLLLPLAGVYAMGFAGKGGNTLFLNSLLHGITSSDRDRPPFDTGRELVGGIVLMAGAHDAAALATIEMIKRLFLGNDSNYTQAGVIPRTLPAPPRNPEFPEPTVDFCNDTGDITNG